MSVNWDYPKTILNVYPGQIIIYLIFKNGGESILLSRKGRLSYLSIMSLYMNTLFPVSHLHVPIQSWHGGFSCSKTSVNAPRFACVKLTEPALSRNQDMASPHLGQHAQQDVILHSGMDASASIWLLGAQDPENFQKWISPSGYINQTWLWRPTGLRI